MKKIYYEKHKARLQAESKERYTSNREMYIKRVQTYQEMVFTDKNYRITNLVRGAKQRSKLKNIPFDINVEDVLTLWDSQDGRCAVSGRLFDLEPSNSRVSRDAASIDRIIPSLGYVKDNIRLVTWQVNAGISEYGLENFMSICHDVINFNRG